MAANRKFSSFEGQHRISITVPGIDACCIAVAKVPATEISFGARFAFSLIIQVDHEPVLLIHYLWYVLKN